MQTAAACDPQHSPQGSAVVDAVVTALRRTLPEDAVVTENMQASDNAIVPVDATLGMGAAPRGTEDAKAIERDVIEREWPLDADGFPHRKAARIVLINPQGEMYLIHGHDVDDPTFNWWFTVGGGILAGESARKAAVRELHEETGLELSPARLEGPVLYRQATFHFVGSTRKQDESFFLARLDRHEEDIVTAGAGRKLTALEENVLDRAGWFSPSQLDQLIAAGDHVFPQELAQYVRVWHCGWDGCVIHLAEEEK